MLVTSHAGRSLAPLRQREEGTKVALWQMDESVTQQYYQYQ